MADCAPFGWGNGQCTEQKVFTNTATCSICGGTGHIASDCKERRVPAGERAAPSVDQQTIDSEYTALMAELGEGPSRAPAGPQSSSSRPAAASTSNPWNQSQPAAPAPAPSAPTPWAAAAAPAPVGAWPWAAHHSGSTGLHKLTLAGPTTATGAMPWQQPYAQPYGYPPAPGAYGSYGPPAGGYDMVSSQQQQHGGRERVVSFLLINVAARSNSNSPCCRRGMNPRRQALTSSLPS
jgi:splicing factor 1